MAHKASRSDNGMILYLVSNGADPKAVNRGSDAGRYGERPIPARDSSSRRRSMLLRERGAKDNHKCVSCEGR